MGYRNAYALTILCGLTLSTSAQTNSPTATGAGGLPAQELEKLVAPIALYPDVLVSQILPAATFPTDIVQAMRWRREHPDLADLENQKWDVSVLTLCHYPQILERMDKDLDWTNALGSAFLDQPQELMTAIQRLRARAEAAGLLQTTPQQTVVVQEEVIRIVPTEKEVVYVPQYNPQVIYVEVDDDDDDDAAAVATAAAISFGVGLAMGAWLDNDCDWDDGGVVICRPGYWGGWGWHGAVAWDDDWVAMRGRRRGMVVGDDGGGVYVGPRGAAVWGDDGHGAAWRRPTTVGGPAYTGRYSSYNNVQGNRRNVVAGNDVNINNSKNVNIDRGDRTNIVGGDKSKVVGGDRTNLQAGDKSKVGLQDNRSAFGNSAKGTDVNKLHDRGVQSRDLGKTQAGVSSGTRPETKKPEVKKQDVKKPDVKKPEVKKPAAQPKPASKPSSFSSKGSGNNVSKQSSRGSSSRRGK